MSGWDPDAWMRLVPTTLDHERRRVTSLLVATGAALDGYTLTPGDTQARAATTDLAQALGLTPTVPANPHQKHGETGWVRNRHRKTTTTEEVAR